MSKQKQAKTGAQSARKKVRRNYRAKQNSTSIYFLLWSVFTALSLFIVLLFGVSYQVLTAQTYKREAATEVQSKGELVREAVLLPPPPEFQDNRSAQIRFLAKTHDVDIFILSDTGELLYPQDVWNNESFAFEEKIKVVFGAMQKQNSSTVVYEGKGEYVYASEIPMYGENTYLYVGRSLKLMQTVMGATAGRMIFIYVFVFVLSFAVSGAVSAWLTRPLSEMAEKADKLAGGDFSVDFHGHDYGSEMKALADRLNYARDELSKADGMQKELISNVSHDFKTPLTMIKAYASMIVEISGDNPEKRNKHAQVIIDEADRLTSLVNDVLQLSKMNSGIETMKSETFELSGYLNEILKRFDYLKEVQGYVFETDIDNGISTRGDELKLGQVIYNLIGNAVNYTGEDKRVIIKLKKRNGFARLIIRDTGAGIEKEQLQEIWARYYRSKETHKRPVQGTGLGLSIVKTVLESHKFHFGVESKVGKGTVFYVDFPIVEE